MQRKITITHGIQRKISVCLSVIRKHSRSKAARSGRGLLIRIGPTGPSLFYCFHSCAIAVAAVVSVGFIVVCHRPLCNLALFLNNVRCLSLQQEVCPLLISVMECSIHV